MKLIQLTRGLYAQVDDEDFEWLNQWKWCAHKDRYTYYAVRGVGTNSKDGRILMHRLILGLTDNSIYGEHIDHNGLNNQRQNLRPATHSQNMSNKRSKNNATSKYLGVSWYKSREKWLATIYKGKKKIFLGYFDCEIDAALAYNNAAKKVHGDFANINNILQ